LLTNFSKEILTVPKSTVLGVAEEVSEQLIDEVNPASQTDTQTPPKPPRQKKNEALYNKLLHGKLNHLTQEDRLHIEPVLRRFAHVFHDEDANDFKGTDIIEHQIDIGDARPIRRPQYRVP
jgi:hypothetical protein